MLMRYSIMQRLVGEEGIEPSILKEHDFESCAYTNSATHPPVVAYQQGSPVLHWVAKHGVNVQGRIVPHANNNQHGYQKYSVL